MRSDQIWNDSVYCAVNSHGPLRFSQRQAALPIGLHVPTAATCSILKHILESNEFEDMSRGTLLSLNRKEVAYV